MRHEYMRAEYVINKRWSYIGMNIDGFFHRYGGTGPRWPHEAKIPMGYKRRPYNEYWSFTDPSFT